MAAAGADVVALQEVTPRTLPLWREALGGSALCALDGLAAPGGPKPLGVLVAARSGVLARVEPPDVPWPERVLVCRLGGVEIVDLHSPIAPAADLAKIRTHEAVAAWLADRPGPIVLCGDLNTPRREFADGDVMTFAYKSSGKLREERGERWDAAERALVWGLRQQGWVDAYRSLHGYGDRSASWTFAQDRGGWRLDHVLARGLRPVAAAYAHEWRRAGLSDHSALVVDFQD